MSKLIFRKEDPRRLRELMCESQSFSYTQFDLEGKGIPKMPFYDGAPFELVPNRNGHPRVALTTPLLKKILDHAEDSEAEPAAQAFLEMIESDESGILPPISPKPRGEYTLNNHTLIVLQAKALAYLLSGNREYAVEALNGIRNYLRTIQIRWMSADICRHFGYAMYIAACIYDWCYDLTDADIRHEIICGVGYALCIGETEGILKAGATKRVEKVKMEMGFPPGKQNAVTGHGCELQLMRDYMSFAIAIYDEEPSWWHFVGKRFYTEYPPVRDIFYSAGIYPQGTNYAAFRFQADVWACWLLKTAVGRLPFSENNMKLVLPSLLAFETYEDAYLRSGDDDVKDFLLPESYGTCAQIAAWLFNDPFMKAWGKHFKCGYSDFSTADDPDFHGLPSRITPAEWLILNANGLSPALDRYGNMPLLSYNGGYCGNVIVRNKRGQDAAVCMMKGLLRSSANHDHQDTATFQIAYKGLVSGDSGVYETYGSPQHFYYHQATLAHNGILVYNPAYNDDALRTQDDGTVANKKRYYYSGGQRRVEESGGLTHWLSDEYDMAREIGRKFSFRATEAAQPEYAYYALDYAKAYPASTVNRIERHMLTVFTSDTSVPMLLFVYDDIIAADSGFRKAFLLQCPTQPVINTVSKTVEIKNGNGKLVLKNVSGADKILTFGGKERQFFNPKDDPDVKGFNIPCIVPGEGSSIWGHAEITAPSSECRSEFMNVLYVTDANQHPNIQIEDLKPLGLCGAFVRLNGETHLFAKWESGVASVSFPLTEHTRCYLFGIPAGQYMLGTSVSQSQVTVNKEEGVLCFNAESGQVKLSKDE